ncbi:MAG: hypothetical protein A3C08_02285 [Candidatus Taylorbacteria bacterium RIFCSPHIGHO2_02_FULL_47_18]|uniref:Uncharacterized protein n=1 Tax=Candidatus Taylorbacteria bacterium RIFCSPLOWO2_01_FULL_48_100 TaxID=1802322 RepID=A0A1G2NFN5_9BACT|nr:MAG: hypothetical protein A3C08_02285 [Candidatus Taylorbacteria bacterium RIFCSPHIGHO2_02_FULL_47_18]OHA34191.1 MAG: hypothetical protein A2938_00745 [Candidatus Taylorbacteria bacterium RIFCSPLOWO2_01_FULL_48_100]OHA40789.1 MAG: hypothetical protein A3J31_00575 [Candidatus Taylorbacteria bacterium RIFCSPLOWO2_02_FULL_48_16]OHA45350.1 MAG: hypothetical protein A3H13_00860 [Candidatus Taylorbacteria bacterium RIFCSPLOWO2_12_FULL_48_11]
MYTIIFGWGKKQKSWKTPDGKNLVVTWNYFNFFWCPIGFNVKWHLIEDEKIDVHVIVEDRVVSFEKVKEIFPEQTPDLNVWERYGLIIIIIVIAIINIWF